MRLTDALELVRNEFEGLDPTVELRCEFLSSEPVNRNRTGRLGDLRMGVGAQWDERGFEGSDNNR